MNYIKTLSILFIATFNVSNIEVANAADLAKGKALFEERCVSCHGTSGLGDGPIGASLPAESKPANLQTAKYKYATDVAKMKELLQKGGAGVGLNPLMTGAPGVSDADLDSLIAYINSLKK